ncbi:MAG: UDP-N-acetylmuramoyl-tripeptide--D-alanyl-D-alanine ligase [Phycisphaerales bacterium]|nr:UDP-N-acetylmuramoyl-tripeptide--D-alanyl-D-alanine ligase [Phycisphaerales bacterium]
MPFTTEQLEQYVSGQLIGRSDVECQGAEIDTRRSIHGKVFFALKGEQADGHDYIEDAVRMGCAAVVVSKPVKCAVPVVIVECPRTALFELALKRREFVTGTVIAITGSVGKTTTKNLIAVLLGNDSVCSPRSFNNDLGIPLTMLDAEGAPFVVVEVGANEVGEIPKLATLVRPDVAVLTAIAPAHLEGFGSIEAIVKEKCSLLESLCESGKAITGLNVDISQASICCPVISIDDQSWSLSQSALGNSIIAIDETTIELQLLGAHNAMNGALALIATEEAFRQSGVNSSRIELLQTLKTVHPTEGRMSSHFVDDVTFINDAYNANPASMSALLQFASGCDAKRKVLVLGDMLELGPDEQCEHEQLAKQIASVNADVVCLVGDAMKYANKRLTGAHYFEIATQCAMDSIAGFLNKGDIVFLKGSRGIALERVMDSFSQRKVLQP